MSRVVGKVKNSGPEPDDLEAFAQKYEEKFNQEFGDRFRDTRGTWGFNPALRQVMKIAANCGWGKHAQRIIQVTSEILNDEDDCVRIEEIVRNTAEQKYKIKNLETVGEGKRLFEFLKQENTIKPDLHKIALDAAAFVPAYGRLQLWQQLDKLEKSNPGNVPRVVNMDTDSIYYKWYPGDVYNIPEGELLGDWTRDDDPSKGGIMEFVGLGPKTYCYQHTDGSQSAPKTKGVRLGYSTQGIVNFDSFKAMAVQQLELVEENYGQSKKRCAKPLGVPQTGFISKRGKMLTVRNLKKLGIDANEMKRDLNQNGFMYPFGYNDAPERIEPVGDWDELVF